MASRKSLGLTRGPANLVQVAWKLFAVLFVDLTYYPEDSPGNSDSDLSSRRLARFLDSLGQMPGMWVHFGHGDFDRAVVDMLFDASGKVREYVGLDENDLLRNPRFNLFKRMSHVRLVGCETNSQNLYSFGQVFMSKPYGGALSYVAAANYSYPVVESQLLQHEFSNLADSTLFTWGEVWDRAAGQVLAGGGAWDVARWVVLTRNFSGDPLLPVRYRHLSGSDALSIAYTGSIAKGSNGIIVTVTNGGEAVEGAQVGVVSQNIRTFETTDPGVTEKQLYDLGFAHGVTNKEGKVSLSFRLNFEDSISITAVHPNFLPTRMNVGITPSARRLSVGVTVNDFWSPDSDIASRYNGYFEPSESLLVRMQFTGDSAGEVVRGKVDVQNITIDTGNGIAVSGIHGRNFTFPDSFVVDQNHPYENHPYYAWDFMLTGCPPGGGQLTARVPFTYSVDGSAVQYDTAVVHIPVVGPKVFPIINYLVDQNASLYPSNGSHVRVRLLLGDQYPAKARGVSCRLFGENSTFVHIDTARTAGSYVIGPHSAAYDSTIAYTIQGGYDEGQHGVLTAKLEITGSNFQKDTFDIDLNPMRISDFAISKDAVTLDYRNGAEIRWNQEKYSASQGRRSDFLGYVVTRVNLTTDSSVLLTPTPVTSTNYLLDRTLPAGDTSHFEYTVSVVDQEHNCSAVDAVTVKPAPVLKPGFPIFVGNVFREPVVADHERDGQAEVYAAQGPWGGGGGSVIGFRADGQEAVVKGPNDGVAYHQGQAVVIADVNNDGHAEGIYGTGDSLVVQDMSSGSVLWERSIKTGHDTTHSISWFRPPIVADINGDGGLEIITSTMDNGGTDGATVLHIFSGNGDELARHRFADGSYAPALAVGDFVKNGDGKQSIVTAGIQRGVANSSYQLNVFSDLDTSTHEIALKDSMFLCEQNAPDSARSWIVNSALSAGNLFGGRDTMEVVLSKGKAAWSGPDVKDTVFVYMVDSTGHFLRDGGGAPLCASYPISLLSWDIFGTTPALADLDGDGKDEIVYASDDTVYLLKMTALTTLDTIQKMHFGRVPANRLDGNDYIPQAIVADVDNDGALEIVVNHQGDGTIWAFKKGTDGKYKAAPGFPFAAQARVAYSCAVSDLEGDGILDLVAVDDGGYVYAWKLGPGSINAQPWPSKWGNSWNTGYTGYKPASDVGYLYEDWRATKEAPYKWLETGAGNSLAEVPADQTVFTRSNGTLVTSAAGDRNYHFTGLGMRELKNYTVKGKIKFDNTSAEFGVNLYSQWPDSAKKYSVLRGSNGLMRLYYYSDATTRNLLGTLDTSGIGAKNDLASLTNTWYEYRIIAMPASKEVFVKVWRDGTSEPSTPGIDAVVTYPFNGGLAGVVSASGSGNRYWGPITLTSNDVPQGAFMAYEDLRADSIVDVKPYTPGNWHPDAVFSKFGTAMDTSGFQLHIVPGDTCLIYQHTPGTTIYPVTCRLAPQTNLTWRDYTYSGTIVKPKGAAYDSVEVGLPFYWSSPTKMYNLLFKRTGVYVSGGTYGQGHFLDSMRFAGGDSVSFAISVQTHPVDEVADRGVLIRATASVNGDVAKNLIISDDDKTSGRITEGVPGIQVDYSKAIGPGSTALQPVRFKTLSVEKIN